MQPLESKPWSPDGGPVSQFSVECAPVAPGDFEDLARLFERAGAPCYCQYWQFQGDSRQWQDRCANDRNASRQALRADLEEGRMRGLVARLLGGPDMPPEGADSQDGPSLIGWLRLESAAGMHKHYDSRLYRSLPVLSDSKTTATAGLACFLVDPTWRRHGVARALLAAAVNWAGGRGLSRLEAFPRGATDVTDEEQWLGPVALYEEAGFERIVDFAPYPVYRLALSTV